MVEWLSCPFVTLLFQAVVAATYCAHAIDSTIIVMSERTTEIFYLLRLEVELSHPVLRNCQFKARFSWSLDLIYEILRTYVDPWTYCTHRNYYIKSKDRPPAQAGCPRGHRFRAGGRVLRKTKEKRGKERGEVSWTKARLIDRSIVFTLSTEQWHNGRA